MMAASKGEAGGEAKSHLYADENFSTDDWLAFYIQQIRDCAFYKQEFEECKTWKARFYQNYVYGDKLNCDHWNQVFKHCLEVKHTGDKIAMENVVQHELARRKWRLSNARANDVWEYRTEPPEDWLKPVQTVKQGELLTENVQSEIYSNDDSSAGDITTGSSIQTNDKVSNNTADNIPVKTNNNKNNKDSASVSQQTTTTENKGGWCTIS